MLTMCQSIMLLTFRMELFLCRHETGGLAQKWNWGMPPVIPPSPVTRLIPPVSLSAQT